MAKNNEPIRFTTPASTANIGPGFGVIGIALDAPLTVTVAPRTDGGMVIERRDDPDANLMDPRHDGVLRGFRATAELFGLRVGKGFGLVVEGDVPGGVGMGSNSAAFAAGVAAAARLAKKPWHRNDLLDTVIELGGDPAHGAASLVGGLVCCVPVTQPHVLPRRHRALVKPLHPSWRYVMIMPDVQMATAEARRVLPPTLPHPVTRRTTGRVLGLLHALEHADEELLTACLFDEVHVPYRHRLVPGMEAAMAAGVEAGAVGATISGHGPGLLALTTDEARGVVIASAMTDAFVKAGVETKSLVLEANTAGALPDDSE